MYDLIGYEPDDLYDDDDDLAVAGLDGLDELYEDELEAIAGLDLDDEELEGLASGFELVGYDDDFDDDFAIAGEEYDMPGSVEELLDAGAIAGGRRRRRRGRRHPGGRGGARRARARGGRVRRVIRGLGRRLQRERRGRRRAVQAVQAVRRARTPRPARTIPSVTGGATQLVPQAPQRSGPQVVPFTSSSPIAPGETRVLTARPQVVFRPNNFIVAGRIAEYFRINGIRIGNQNQFAASGAVPAEAFTGVHPMPIGTTTAHPGHDIAIEVTNISASPQEFSAAMSGPALQ